MRHLQTYTTVRPCLRYLIEALVCLTLWPHPVGKQQHWTMPCLMSRSTYCASMLESSDLSNFARSKIHLCAEKEFGVWLYSCAKSWEKWSDTMSSIRSEHFLQNSLCIHYLWNPLYSSFPHLFGVKEKGRKNLEVLLNQCLLIKPSNN